jgi:methylated-DNA-protein-cysteine methyltransferase-like protein
MLACHRIEGQPVSKSFSEQVHAIVTTIPPGRVLTYGDIARILGRPRGGRLVGWAMRSCPEGLPWYRVVNSQGGLSVRARYPDGRLMQRVLLEEEGVTFDAEDRLDLARYAWEGPQP